LRSKGRNLEARQKLTHFASRGWWDEHMGGRVDGAPISWDAVVLEICSVLSLAALFSCDGP
jgi:hypothetical protein